MNKKIFIIHPSEIIRKGLAAILRNYFNHEIIQLEKMEELETYSDLKGQNIILIIGDSYLLSSDPAVRFEKYNQTKTILFRSKVSPTAIVPPFCNESISPETTSLEIHDLISRCWKTRSNRRPATDSSELTIREKDVLRLVALGHSNKVIAEKLFISIHTVIKKKKNITEKTGIKSISGLTVYAILNNLIDTDTINPEDLI